MGKLIIHADDYGISHEVNLAIQRGIQEKVIDRATLMVNMPFAEEAVEMAKAGGYLNRIGLHLNLVEGKPLSEGIKNTGLCSDGFFNGEVSNRKYKTRPIKDKEALRGIEEEIGAQMQRFLSWGMPLHHVDSHQHSHIKPSIFPIVYRLARENGFQSIRLASIMPSDYPRLPVKIYKNYINSRIRKFNSGFRNDDMFPLVNVGCAYLSLKRQTENDNGSFLKNNSIEMWFHPSIENGRMVNLYCDAPFSIEDLINFKVISAGKNQ